MISLTRDLLGSWALGFVRRPRRHVCCNRFHRTRRLSWEYEQSMTKDRKRKGREITVGEISYHEFFPAGGECERASNGVATPPNCLPCRPPVALSVSDVGVCAADVSAKREEQLMCALNENEALTVKVMNDNRQQGNMFHPSSTSSHIPLSRSTVLEMVGRRMWRRACS